MKVKVISRSSSEYIRETKNDIHKGTSYIVDKLTILPLIFQYIEITTLPFIHSQPLGNINEH